MRIRTLLLTLCFVLAGQIGCRRALTITPPVPPDVAGRVFGHTYETQPGGLGGPSQVTVTLYSGQARAFARARLWVDSLTKFEGRARDSVDWRLPKLRGAHVRVWFRGSPSTPHNDEIWAKADIIAIDSLVP